MNERVAVIKNDGVAEIWFIPFKWYGKKSLRRWEPLRKGRWVLDGVKSWKVITENYKQTL